MDLQNTFYAVSIIYMVLMIILLIAIVALAFYIKTKVDEIHRLTEKKIHDISQAPGQLASKAGDIVANFLISKFGTAKS